MTAAASPDDQFISAFNDVEHRLRKGAYGDLNRLTTLRVRRRLLP